MITYLYGTDTYRIKEYLREHAPDAEVGEEALWRRGLFDQAPVVLYEPTEELKIPDDIDVFIVTEKKRKKGIEFKPLKEPELRAWIAQEAKNLGFSISQNAAGYLAAHAKDSWQAHLELEKACNYVEGKGTVINEEHMMEVASVGPEESIFALTDALSHKQRGTALELMAKFFQRGIDPDYLFAMIVNQFRNIIAPGRAGLHPFAAQKARQAARNFDPAALCTLYGKLFELEHDAKNGIRNMVDGLYEFVFSLK